MSPTKDDDVINQPTLITDATAVLQQLYQGIILLEKVYE
jgi:hypothetical protein